MSIAEYTGRLKELADTLYDVGAAVTDHALVINTLRGLNEEYHGTVSIFNNSNNPPSFLVVRSFLIQEERRIKNRRKLAANTALLAGHSTGASAPRPSGTSSSTAPTGGGDRRKKRKPADGRVRPLASVDALTPSYGPRPWTSTYNPWTSVVQAWPLSQWRPTSPGVLGSRPPAPTQAMLATNASSSSSPSLPPELHHAMNNLSLNNPSGTGGGHWFLDTGATSHMANNTGISSSHFIPTQSSQILVGNGAPLQVESIGQTTVPTMFSPLHNILIAPHLIKNLISVRSPTHPMITSGCASITRPNPRYSLATTAPSPPPTSVRMALRDTVWNQAMQDEFDALIANGTWTLVPRPPDAHVVTGKWLFKNKLHSDGTLERRKARWVVRGFTQRAGVDFHQTFSPVIKPTSIRTVLKLVAVRQWPVHQLDVKNAFLHGVLRERVYCHQPSGFVDPDHPAHVCKLVKSIYGLKQASRAWFERLGAYLRHLGFTSTRSDVSLFVYRQGGDTTYILVYVDDILLTASTDRLLHHIIGHLQSEFTIKDLGNIHFFLGVQIKRDHSGFFLTQGQYAEDVLERAGMVNCKPVSTPAEIKPKVSALDGELFDDPTFYRSIAGALQYLTLT
jgi:hypothetical protein